VVAKDFVVMIDLSRAPQAPPMRAWLGLTCAISVLAACSQGNSASNTAGDASAMDNSLADAPPPPTTLPLATGPAPAYRPAPVASALPSAPSAPLGSVPTADEYAYLNQAYAFSQSLDDAPPDYTYDYQGEAPWVWQSPDGYYRVAERLALGVRYFYYAPGASTPYFIQDPQYSYGYSGGRLAVVYGPDGQVLPYDVEARQARAAGLYLAWAARLYAAARHDQHVAVSQARWNVERQAVYADQARWSAAQERNAGWAAYSRAHRNDQAHWADQRYVRAAEAARFAQAVHDPAALAHAQHAATDAHTIAPSHNERPPGPASESAPGHPRDPAAGRARTGDEVQRQAERPPAQAHPPHAAAADGGRQAVAHTHEEHVQLQPSPVRSNAPPPNAQRVVADRSHDESHRQPTEHGPAPARPPRPAPPAEAPRPPEPKAHAPAARPPPRPAPPPAKPKPDAPHP